MKKVLSKSVIISTIISVVMLAAGILIGFLIWGNSAEEDSSYSYDDGPVPFVVGDAGSAYYNPEDEPTLTFEEAFADTAKYNDYYAMQDMTSQICENTKVGSSIVLVDKRDDKLYKVAKMKDGQCWMVQDLTLELSTSKTFTSEDTDLNSVSSWTPQDNTATRLYIDVFPADKDHPYSYSYNDNNTATERGFYYNWTAAIASNDSSAYNTEFSNVDNSICPKGWRLPRVFEDDGSIEFTDFGNLLYAHFIITDPVCSNGVTCWSHQGSDHDITGGEVAFYRSGTVSAGRLYKFGKDINYWSATVFNELYAFGLYSADSIILPQYFFGRDKGMMVRCIAR